MTQLPVFPMEGPALSGPSGLFQQPVRRGFRRIVRLGVALKIFFTGRFPILSTIIYLLMGWMVVLAVKPLYMALPPTGFWLLVAGGLAYTLGVLFYGSPRIPYNHVVWHLFVMAGSICHFCTIFFYLISR